MADGAKSKKSKVGIRTKLSKYFRRRKRRSEFGSSTNILEQCDGRDIEVSESVTDLSTNGEVHNKQKVRSRKAGAKRTASSPETGNTKTGANTSNDSNISIIEVLERSENSANANLLRTSGTVENFRSSDKHNECPESGRQSITGNNSDSDDNNTQATSYDKKSKLDKLGKFKTFRKFKRKFRLSKYKELSESRANVANVVDRDNGDCEDIKKKKRLQERTKNVGKAFRDSLKSALDGYQNLSPCMGPLATNSIHNYRKYNPYHVSLASKPNIQPIFTFSKGR